MPPRRTTQTTRGIALSFRSNSLEKELDDVSSEKRNSEIIDSSDDDMQIPAYDNAFHHLDRYFFVFSHPAVAVVIFFFLIYRVCWWLLFQWEPEQESIITRLYFSTLSIITLFVEILYLVRFRRPSLSRRSFPRFFDNDDDEFPTVNLKREPAEEGGEAAAEVFERIVEYSRGVSVKEESRRKGALETHEEALARRQTERKTIQAHLEGVFRQATRAVSSYASGQARKTSIQLLRVSSRNINWAFFVFLVVWVMVLFAAATRENTVRFLDHHTGNRSFYNALGKGNGTFSPFVIPMPGGYNTSAYYIALLTDPGAVFTGLEAALLFGHVAMPFLSFIATAVLHKVRIQIYYLRLVSYADIQEDIKRARETRKSVTSSTTDREGRYRLHDEERGKLIDGILDEYLNIQLDVREAGNLWEPFLGGVLFVSAIVFLITLYQLFDSTNNSVKTTIFICFLAVFLILFTIALVVYFNSVCQGLEQLVIGAHIDDFAELNGRDYLINYFRSNPLRFEIFGFSITRGFIAGFASAAGTAFVVAAIRFLDPFGGNGNN